MNKGLTNSEESILSVVEDTWRSGAEISQLTGWGSGRIYPALAWFERDGLVYSEWEAMAKPRRRLYLITPKGRAVLWGAPDE
jgi:DNA-binding PadR family transcriptional regulator